MARPGREAGARDAVRALLPSFKGWHAVDDALAYGVKVTGCTVHFVDEELDHGPIILQEAVTVADDAAGTKPTGAIPITTPVALCECNDATGCTMSIAEPTPTLDSTMLLARA